MSKEDPASPQNTSSAKETASKPTTTNTKNRKKSTNTTSNQQTTTFSIRSPSHHYLHLSHLSPSSNSPLDALTTLLHLAAALTTFLGLHGSAIPFDILKLDPESREVWVRIPAEDRAAVVAAVGGWVGGKGESWKVGGRGSSWVVGENGAEGLFEV